VKSVLIDTNLLVLLAVGNVAPQQIGKHRRLKSFDAVDFAILLKAIDDFSRHLTLPNTFTETSNLIGSGERSIAASASLWLAKYALQVAEVYEPSEKVVQGAHYMRLGLTDVAIVAACRADVTVVTDDYALYGSVRAIGGQAVNIRHARTPR
jgi:rRNA-processing protein FCF1